MAERNSSNLVFAMPWMPLGPFSETHFMVATDSASAFPNASVAWAWPRGWVGQGAGLVDCAAAIYLSASCIPACVPLLTVAGRNGKQAYG